MVVELEATGNNYLYKRLFHFVLADIMSEVANGRKVMWPHLRMKLLAEPNTVCRL
jgi:hypothetical protein